MLEVTFDHSEDVAMNTKTFWFKPKQIKRYTAGQFTEIKLPHAEADKRGDKRWFTLSSSPTENKYAITTKFAPKNGSSFKKRLLQLKPGERLKLADPMGDFVLPRDTSIPLIFVAGGLGITPVRSMVKWLLDTGERRDIQLIYAVSDIKALAFRSLFEQYGLKLNILVSKPSTDKSARDQLSADKILDLTNGLDAKLVYLSGPEPLVEKLDKELKAKNIDPKNIVNDFFPGYTDV